MVNCGEGRIAVSKNSRFFVYNLNGNPLKENTTEYGTIYSNSDFSATLHFQATSKNIAIVGMVPFSSCELGASLIDDPIRSHQLMRQPIDRLLVGHIDGTIAIYNLNTSEKLIEYEVSLQRIETLCSVGPGRLAILCFCVITIINSINGEILYTIKEHQGLATRLQLCYLGNDLLAAGGDDKSITIWELKGKTKQLTNKLRLLPGYRTEITCLIPLGEEGSGILACGFQDGTIRIYDIMSNECLRTFNDHKPYIIQSLCVLQTNMLLSISENFNYIYGIP